MTLKTSIDQLAVFGGPSAFDAPFYVGRPNIGDRERLMARINDMLDRRWLTNNGPLVQEFEEKIQNYTGVKHCVAMNNGTIALEIAARAADLSGEVIVPSFTFVATAHALQWQNITPVFCDADPKTHNIDPTKVEALITPNTTGILATHLWGNPCDIDALQEIADRHNIKLMFDAAHAFGCAYKGKMIGNFGDGEVYSFHATKFINAFEGGAFVTNDDDLAEKARLMRNFGFSGYDQVVFVGTNGKINEACAAMGLTCLESIEEIIETNLNNYTEYKKQLTSIPGIELFAYNGDEAHNYQYIITEIDEDVTGVTRDQMTDILSAEGVHARRYFKPGCHNMEPYKSTMPQAKLWLSETERLCTRVMALPNGTAVNQKDIGDIMSLVRFIVENGAEISQRF